MASRKIIIPVDSVLEMFKSYTAENNEIPADALPITLLVKPQEMGKFAIVARSNDWAENLPPLQIHFDIKRNFIING